MEGEGGRERERERERETETMECKFVWGETVKVNVCVTSGFPFVFV